MMEKQEGKVKDTCGSILIFVISLNVLFTVLLLTGLAHTVTRITQQEHELGNLRNTQDQCLCKEIYDRMPKVTKNESQEFQPKTEIVEDKEQKISKAESVTSRKQRAAKSNGSDGKRSHTGKTKFRQSAHIVGHGGRKVPAVKNGTNYLMTSWKARHLSGHMSYSNGYLTIGKKGYYYIYSQIYNMDGRMAFTGYEVYIDEKPVINVVHSVVSMRRKYDTKYVGGVFYIRPGQRITLRTPYKRTFGYYEGKSYFGAFLIHQ